MARPMPGMGRGLEAILSASSEDAAAPAEQLRQLPVDLMAPNPRQPRRRFEPDSLQSLASSIEEQGLLQPVLVRPLPGGSYELIAGERRWRAAQLAGLRSIPAISAWPCRWKTIRFRISILKAKSLKAITAPAP